MTGSSSLVRAMLWGLLSAVSLPIGAITAIVKLPTDKTQGIMLAFGAGALFNALAIELFGHLIFEYEGDAVKKRAIVLMMVAASVVGGGIFSSLDNVLDRCGMPSIPSFARFRTKVVRVQASKGMTVQMMHQRSTLALLETKFKLKASTDEDRVALARSGHSSYPKHVEEVAMTALSARLAEKKKPDIVNVEVAPEAPPEGTSLDQEDSKVKLARHTAIMIWMGILIDAIPESLIIGFMVAEGVQNPLVLVVGVFLSNFPEATSSAGLMRKAGLSDYTIVLMWTSICVVTGLGSLVGAAVVPGHEEGEEHEMSFILTKAGIQAVAAGSMLTMIAQTALPEAVHLAGSAVGMSTLCGFLCGLLTALAE